MILNLRKAGLLTLVLLIFSIGVWEFYLRSGGVGISYNDDAPLWAYKRSQIYDAPQKSTYFIGASRIKFDLDIPTWENLTRESAVQLALVGTSPQLILKNLADDEKFTGKLIIDITEMVLYSRDPGDQESAKKSLKYFKEITPAQRASFYVNHLLESQFVFLETKVFSLNALLSRQINLPNRQGVWPEVNFPVGFEPAMFNRQNVMSEKFLKDTSRQIAMKMAWTQFGLLNTAPGISGDTLQNIFIDIKRNIDKIKARSGQVMFIRPPSSGEMRESEKIAYPRKTYWDDLLAFTNTDGIYADDYPGLSDFICPEWSHLSPADAILFTKELVRVLKEKGWVFPNK